MRSIAIRYRLAKPGVKSYPQAVYDVKAAVQFVRAKAADLGVDPARIGAHGRVGGRASRRRWWGLPAGEPQFSSLYRDDPNAGVPADVKAVVSFYGIYDMQAQWEHDQLARPSDQITEKFLGMPPMKDRKVYFEASPAAYATVDKNRTRFFLIAGKEDDIVDPKQATDFLNLLKQAGFNANIALLPGAGACLDPGAGGRPVDVHFRSCRRGCCGSCRGRCSPAAVCEEQRAGNDAGAATSQKSKGPALKPALEFQSRPWPSRRCPHRSKLVTICYSRIFARWLSFCCHSSGNFAQLVERHCGPLALGCCLLLEQKANIVREQGWSAV